MFLKFHRFKQHILLLLFRFGTGPRIANTRPVSSFYPVITFTQLFLVAVYSVDALQQQQKKKKFDLQKTEQFFFFKQILFLKSALFIPCSQPRMEQKQYVMMSLNVRRA